MYVYPIRILRLDGKVVRPRKQLLLQVTDKESAVFRRRGLVLRKLNPKITVNTVIIKLKEFQNEDQAKVVRVGTDSGGSDSGRSENKKRQLHKADRKVSKRKDSRDI